MTMTKNFLTLIEEQATIVSPNTPDEHYISKISEGAYNSLSILVCPYFIEKTVPEEFAALRNVFKHYGAPWKNDCFWSDIIGVGVYDLDDFIESVEKSEYHSEECRDQFYEEVAIATKAVCEKFKELTSLEVDLVMTNDDESECIPYGSEEIMPFYGPNFSIIESTETTTIDNILAYKDEISIYLANM